MSEFSESQFQTLFAYHWYTNQRLLEKAGNLSEADYHENPGYGHGSIHDLFFHILRTNSGWRRALESGRQLSPLQRELFADLDSIQAGFAREQQAWQTLLDGLTPERVVGSVNLATSRGDVQTIPLWRILQHLVLHGMQHHADLAQVLTRKGQSPGDLDFIFFG